MSIKNKVFAAAATLTLVGGVGAAGAMSASAATPSAGPNAVDIYSPLFGSHHNPAYVLDVLRQGEKAGQPIILFRAANYDPAEDFTISYQGLVSDFFAAGLVTSAVELHYGGGSTLPNGTKTADDPAFEIEYSPYGVDSGLCAGVGTTAANETKVALEPCGVTAKTVWIADVGLVPGTRRVASQHDDAFDPGFAEQRHAKERAGGVAQRTDRHVVFGRIQPIGDGFHRAGQQDPACDRTASRRNGMRLEIAHDGRIIVFPRTAAVAQHIPVENEDDAAIGFAKVDGGSDQRVENRLQIERRAADHFQNVGGGGLLFSASCVSLNIRAFWIAIAA